MADYGADKGTEPAPWESPGKRHTQMRPGGPPPPPTAYPAPPAPAQGYIGPPPAPPAYPPALGAAPVYGAPVQYGTPPQPPAGAPYPQQAAGPYAPPGFNYVQPGKPNSTMAIISLVLLVPGVLVALLTLGVGGIPFFLAGIVLGGLALRETGAFGRKSGRGLAVAGTVVNSVLLVGAVAAGVGMFVLVKAHDSAQKEQYSVIADSHLIITRVRIYQVTKGDLEPGGPQMIGGHRSDVAVQGTLKVSDLVSPSELELDMNRYRLDVDASAGRATLYYTDNAGKTGEVGSHSSALQNFRRDRFDRDDFSFD